MKIPQRNPVLLQTIDILRAAISEGTWGTELPSERDLCKRLHISRPTIRAALEVLERENLVQKSPGKGRIVNAKPTARRFGKLRAGDPPSKVVLISSTPLYAMSRNRIFVIDQLHQSLEANSIQFEIYSNPAFSGERPQSSLRQMLRKTEGSSYILALTSRECQQWFVRQELNCMIVGSSFPDIAIPSIDCDYRAVGRHAAGTLLGRGHRNILLISPDEPLAGRIELEEAFMQELSGSTHPDVTCHLVRHLMNPQSVIDAWQRHYDRKDPVTAAFVINPDAAATLTSHLLRQHIDIPNQISILCSGHTRLNDWIQPSIAHYALPLQQFANKLAALATRMVQGGTLPTVQTRITPELILGSSLAHRSPPVNLKH